ncbi:ttll6 [Symbiodinium pilosum]|uniref:Ttll6 protein n=1 Tax=Symbiodinium pilosum TaxID=2952 RepID=A0A812IN52_SYMPI|nr:ttll6 [Symbiodinium pilosum]
MAEAAARREDKAAENACLARAEALVRAVSTNYTILDWLSTQWPTFRMLHRMQFDLLPDEAAAAEGFWLQADLVPEDPDTGGPMKFAFNKGFVRPDALYIDVAADIVGTDMLRTLPAFFGMRAARPGERWNVGLAYTSNDYGDLVPSKDLWRLRATRQKLVFVPDLQEVIGEKDQQCRAYYDALDTWQVSKSLANEVGGMPKCFDMPGAAEELRAFASETPRQDGLMAFVRKPEGAWGGRGIEIRFGVHHLLGDADAPLTAGGACDFIPLEDAQCLGLDAGPEESSESSSSCREACCALGSACEAWNWRDYEGCWVGIPRFCTDSNPTYLGGWRGGRRPRGSSEAAPSPSAKQRAVVQQYILDPVLYQLEGVWPPITVKTDIRIYGTVVSMDPFRFYISEYGYFRSGFLEKNYSASNNEDFEDALMHVTHHIPKIEAGTYQCPTAPSWGHPSGAEHDAGSGGSLHKWFRIAEEQNGLDPKVVWKNIKLALSIFLLGTRNKLDCASNAIHHACGSVGFHFFADLVVDRRGRAYLMEIHPTLAVKSPGLGDPEAGWVEVLTRSTRQGTLGSLAMSFIGWANAPYRRWVESVLRRQFRSKHRWRLELQGVQHRLDRQRSRMPGWSGEATSVVGLLSKVLVEEHLACRLAVMQVLPALWSDVAAVVGPNPEGGDPFKGLRSFYRLLAAARRWIAERKPGRGSEARDDFKSELLGFQGLLQSQLVAIQQALSAGVRVLGFGNVQIETLGVKQFSNLTRQVLSNHDTGYARTEASRASSSPLREPLLPLSPGTSPSNVSKALIDLERSPGGNSTNRPMLTTSVSRDSLRSQARLGNFGVFLSLESGVQIVRGGGVNSGCMVTQQAWGLRKPVLTKPKEIKSLAQLGLSYGKSVMDSINNKDVLDPEKLYSKTGWCQAVARSPYFKSMTMAMVVLSTFWIAIDTDYNQGGPGITCFQIVDNVICAYFCFEISIRWLAFQEPCDALTDNSFLFDLFLAVSMAFETWGFMLLSELVGWETTHGSPGITPSLRALRLIRITRAFRMSRIFRFVPELMILLHGMFQAIRSVLTTLLLLVLVTYTFAVAMTQLLQNKSVGNGRFDSVPEATVFLLLQTLCGFDQNFMMQMMKADGLSFAFMLAYQLIGSLTLMNMLIGVMVDVVGTTAQLEQEEQSLKTLKRDIADVVRLTDENEDRTVTAVEFNHMIQNPEAVKKLYEGGVNVLALVDYADFVFRDATTLSLEDFVETVLQFRGCNQATVKDVADLRVFVAKELARLAAETAAPVPAV